MLATAILQFFIQGLGSAIVLLTLIYPKRDAFPHHCALAEAQTKPLSNFFFVAPLRWQLNYPELSTAVVLDVA